MNREEVKKEVKPNGGLMKKTKTELIDIILRKDEVEHDLRDKLTTMDSDYTDLSDNYNDAKADCLKYKKVIKDLEGSYAAEKYDIAVLRNKYSKTVVKHIIFELVLILVIISMFLF